MKMQGVVAKWNQDKAFGFIRSPQSSQQVFFHIREFSAPGGDGPHVGQNVEFETVHVGGKGPRATAVRPVSALVPPERERPVSRQSEFDRLVGGHPAPQRRTSTGGSARSARRASGGPVLLPLMVIWAAAIVGAGAQGLLPRWSMPVLVLINFATFYLYWWDKYAAGKGHWRTSEQSLQLWGLVGGWPAAWAAQRLLRHKSSKESFLSVYHVCVGLHCAALTFWLLWKAPREWLTALRAWS